MTNLCKRPLGLGFGKATGAHQAYPFRRASCGFVYAKRPPSVCRQGFWNYLKHLMAQFKSYLAFTLMWWVSWPLSIFVFLAPFSAVWWPNIWPKMGFRNFWHFPNFSYKLLWYLKYTDTLVGKMMSKSSGTKLSPKNSHLCRTWLQNRNLYWIFLDAGAMIRAEVYCPHLWA